MNDPSNPTGASYPESALIAIGEVCLEFGVYVILDEIYGALRFDSSEPAGLLRLLPALTERALIVDGVSKAFSMTGWRIGWAVGPTKWIQGMSRWQSHATSNATSISQWASLAALQTPDVVLAEQLNIFRQRRDIIYEGLQRVEGWRTQEPQGAFYIFPNVEGWFGRSSASGQLQTSLDVCNFLLEEAGLALVPGDPFGAPGHVRLSFALSTERLREGMDRLQAASLKLQ